MSLWAVVLAGGEGRRMGAWVRLWLGEEKPKQYCVFTGRRSMLEHAAARAARIAGPSRVVTVIGRGHRRYLSSPLPGRVLEQPSNRDTGPGTMLPLSYILHRDPGAAVVVLPSDHFVRPEEGFAEQAREAAGLAESPSGPIVLLGAEPDGPETDYGWIAPGEPIQGRARAVSLFHEKPSPGEAEAYRAAGGLWNTLVLAARARALWELAARRMPEAARRLEAWRKAIDTEFEETALSFVYAGMPPANLSRALLEAEPGRLWVLPLRGVAWSDWGRPERVKASLSRLGERAEAAAPEPASV